MINFNQLIKDHCPDGQIKAFADECIKNAEHNIAHQITQNYATNKILLPKPKNLYGWKCDIKPPKDMSIRQLHKELLIRVKFKQTQLDFYMPPNENIITAFIVENLN